MGRVKLADSLAQQKLSRMPDFQYARSFSPVDILYNSIRSIRTCAAANLPAGTV